MAPIIVGYARVSTEQQDLTAQLDALTRLGADPDHVYVDHGLTGTNRERPGLERALAAVRKGDTLLVTKLDRLGRSVPDLRDISEELAARGVALSIGGTTYDPSDPFGKMWFGIVSLFAEFEADLIRARTREGMAVAKARGRLRGKQPKLSPAQRRHLHTLLDAGEHTQVELAELFGVSRTTIYREEQRRRAAETTTPPSPVPSVSPQPQE